MIVDRTPHPAAQTPRRVIAVLGCLLTLAGPPAVMAVAQSPTSSESEETRTDAPTLEAGEPWTLQVDDVSITAILRTDPIETGSPILIEFLRTGSGDDGGLAPIELPPPGTELGSFEVIETSPLAGTGPDGPAPSSRLTLRTFIPGPQELPPISLVLGDRSVQTPARTLIVDSIAGLDTDVESHQDIAAAVDVPSPPPVWFWWAIAAGTAGVLATLVLFWWWRRRPRPVPPPEPADSWALARLDRLASDELLRDGLVDPFFSRLTDIAREYVERRFGIAAPDRTTPEFIEAARVDHRMEPAHRDRVLRLGTVLRTADLVKFAGDRPARTACEDALEEVRTLVIEIGPKPAPEPEAGDAGSGPNGTEDGDRIRRRSLDQAVDVLDRMESRE